jgi:hypothetical protein
MPFISSVRGTYSAISNLRNRFRFKYVSRLSFSNTGWPTVDSSPMFNEVYGETDPCSGLMTFDQAQEHARLYGGRLPTLDEILNNRTAGTGCGYDANRCWTATKGNSDQEHWTACGRNGSGSSGLGGSGAILPQTLSNSDTAYVRFVADIDINREDPVFIEDDSVIAKFLQSQGAL